MPIQILMPALSPTMTEGNLVKWHKKEGDPIKAGQLLAEIETDKATMEIEAVDEGVLGKILVAEGTENVKVNALIGLILEDGEDATSINDFVVPAVISQPLQSNMPLSVVGDGNISNAVKDPLSFEKGESSSRVFASPLARRIAASKGISLENIEGTGPRGRIVKYDVENYVPSKTIGATAPLVQSGGYTDINLNSMRKTIAKRLLESKQNIPHFYLTVDCLLDELMKLRSSLNQLPEAEKLSVNDFIIKACAMALRKVPEANVTFHGTFVRQYDDVDISVAVAIEGGLVTPVIRQADKKTVRQISIEMRSLAERARAGKLKPEEYQGGSFTLSNLGMFGVKHFGAIINPPQASILAVGTGEIRPVVKDNVIVPATVMNCTLSVDHGALDGAVGARFLDAIKQNIQQPLLLLV